MCGVKCITFALWINILSVITGKKTYLTLCLINSNLPHFIILTVDIFFFFFTEKTDFKLELTPLKPVIHVGTDLELTCQATACPVNVTFRWTALQDNSHSGRSKDEQNVSRLMIRNITIKHNIKVVCRATCNGKPIEKTSDIRMYCK